MILKILLGLMFAPFLFFFTLAFLVVLAPTRHLLFRTLGRWVSNQAQKGRLKVEYRTWRLNSSHYMDEDAEIRNVTQIDFGPSKDVDTLPLE